MIRSSRQRTLLLLLPLLWMAGCSAGRQQENGADTTGAGSSPGTVAALGSLPATYTGVFPCEGCEGVDFVLHLRPDSIYILRTTYRGGSMAGKPVDEIGVWRPSADSRRITLAGRGDIAVIFGVESPTTLRLLNGQAEAHPEGNYKLTRSAARLPFEPKLQLRGTYAGTGETGTFTECISRLRLPVAREGAHAALEAAYLGMRREPGEPLLASVVARIALRPAADGSGNREMLVVERFDGILPSETCGSQSGTAEIGNTYWKLVSLGDRPVVTLPDRREAHLKLVPETGRAEGFSGCNSFSGGYTLDGAKLSFREIISTKMACADGMEVETGFFGALGAAATYRIIGEHMELYDAAGKKLARFEAVYLR